MKSRLGAGLIFFLALACVVSCATPVGVMRASEQTAYRQLNESALSGDRWSPYSAQVLERLTLARRFEKDPQSALASLREGLGGPDEPDRLFALAELSLLTGRRLHDPQQFLASALYAYVFLFPEDAANTPNLYDPRLRLAMDIYNRAITEGLRDGKGNGIDLKPRHCGLPFGKLEIKTDSTGFNYGGYRLVEFVSAGDYKTRGLRNHYRRAGIGAPLLGRTEQIPGQAASQWLSPNAKVPATAFLRFDAPRRALNDGSVTAQIELYDVDQDPTVRVGASVVPLSSDPSVALAYGLQGSPLWDFEIAGFRRGDFTLFGKKAEGELLFTSPWRPGRIPVVFVHGTASSPARWAQMFNELLGDPNVASRYQFWFYIYNSGNPIALSALRLRENLSAAVKELDPEGKDPALRNMVVIGHSQGGLLAKMLVVSSGSRFWDNFSKTPFDQAKLSPETRDLVQRGLFVEPLPFVRREIFIATPQRGSFMAEGFIGRLGRRFITLPASLAKTGLEMIATNPSLPDSSTWRIPTAIDNMNGENPFLRTLASLPLAPGVTAHSIIAVKGKGPVEKGDDGVVRYSSAHIEGVESELVVRSGHSCQANPHTIEEVRRILYEHAGVHQ